MMLNATGVVDLKNGNETSRTLLGQGYFLGHDVNTHSWHTGKNIKNGKHVGCGKPDAYGTTCNGLHWSPD